MTSTQGSSPRPIGRWVPAVFAALLPVLFLPITVDAYILPRAALTLAGAGLIAGAGLHAARGRGGIFLDRTLRLPAAAVGFACLAAGVLSVAPALSFTGAYGRYESAPMRLAYLGLFGGAAALGGRERTVTAFLAGCGVAAVEALFEAATHSLARPDGNLGQPNLLGALLAMAVPLSVWRALGGGADRRWLLLAGLLGAGLAVSTSRSGWLGALAGLGVLAVFAAPARRLRPTLVLGALGLVAAAGLLVASPLRGLNADTGAGRLGVWRDSLAVIADRPLLGAGEDTMGLVFGRHQSADWEPGHNFDRAHSMPLDLAASQGVVGLGACAWLFGAWWRRVWRRRELAGVAGAVAAYLVWSLLNFDWAPATAAVWLLAGSALEGSSPLPTPRSRLRGDPGAGEVGGGYQKGPPPYPPRKGEGVFIYAAAAVVATGLVLAVQPVAADFLLYRGEARLAAAVDPLQAHYQAARGDLVGLREAALLGDPDPGTYVALGDAEAAAGDARAARAAYRRALAIYPFEPTARRRAASG